MSLKIPLKIIRKSAPRFESRTSPAAGRDGNRYTMPLSIFIQQIDGFEYGPNGMGWFFWNAKIENDGYLEWNYLFLLKKGIVPSNLCQRETVCNSKLWVILK